LRISPLNRGRKAKQMLILCLVILILSLAAILVTGLIIPFNTTAASDVAKYGGCLKLIGAANLAYTETPDDISTPGYSACSFVCTKGLLSLGIKGNPVPFLLPLNQRLFPCFKGRVLLVKASGKSGPVTESLLFQPVPVGALTVTGQRHSAYPYF